MSTSVLKVTAATTEQLIAAGFKPAQPTVAEMKGATIRCIFYRPFDRPVIQKIGTVTATKTYKNTLYLFVEATDKKSKWVSEFDFIDYVPQVAVNQKATAA